MSNGGFDYYDCLGVSKDANEAAIKKAYKKLALKYHPDKTGNDAASNAKFQQIAEAYDCLKDPSSRAAYDSGAAAGVDYDDGFEMGRRAAEQWQRQQEDRHRQRQWEDEQMRGHNADRRYGGGGPGSARGGFRRHHASMRDALNMFESLFGAMEEDMSAMKHFQSAIAHKLGFITPPLPTVDQCIAVLEGMEKSRAVAGICTDGYSETQALRRELKRAKKNHEAAMISNDALRRQVDELRQSAGSQPKVSTHRDRKLMRLFHPDNYTNAAAEVRTKMVEAYRLVSESRPDA